jgi:hypothetical protein
MARISIRSSLALLWLMTAAPGAAAPPTSDRPAPGQPAPDRARTTTAPAAESDPARSLTFDVPPEGGAYTIDVHPQILTVLHFPSEVRVAYCLEGPGHAEITHHQYSVTIQPDRRTRHAGVNVTTATNHVGVLLRVVENPEDAVLQVHFRDQDVAAEIERRVDEGIARRRAELEAHLSARERRVAEKEQRVDEHERHAALQQTADALRRRFRVRDVLHTVRRDEAILRMHRAVRIGDDVHVFVTLDNRRGTPVVIDHAVFIIDRVSRRAIVSLPTNGYDGVRGVVKPDTKVTGVITLPGVRAGKVARLRVIEQDGRRPFELGLRIED